MSTMGASDFPLNPRGLIDSASKVQRTSTFLCRSAGSLRLSDMTLDDPPTIFSKEGLCLLIPALLANTVVFHATKRLDLSLIFPLTRFYVDRSLAFRLTIVARTSVPRALYMNYLSANVTIGRPFMAVTGGAVPFQHLLR